MNVKQLNRLFARAMYGMAIVAMVLSLVGVVYAQDEAPFLRAFPDGNAVDGGDWPLDATVYIAINDPATADNPDYEDSATVVASDEGWISTYVRFDFDGVYDLKQGDVVTMTSGAVSQIYTVRQLFVENIDLASQIVSGTVDGQQTVHVWVGAADEYVESNGAGNWTVDLSAYDEPMLFPGVCGNAEAWGENNANSTIIDWCVPRPFWRDDFDGQLAEGWDWINENSDKWNLTENSGFLRIYAALNGAGSENLLFHPVVDGDFMIKTHLLFEPDTNFQFAGLVIWQDEYNFLQLGRAFCDVADVCVGNGLYFDRVEGGNPIGGNFATPIGNPSDVYLRLERRGDMVRAFYSMDEGITWYEIGIHWIPEDFEVNGVGLTASQDIYTPDWDIPADFDFFELTEGWGFLPEGFHDYDEGNVPDWACNAGGWAADPDDRETDVNIEIVVDDQTVANLVAGEFRQDLYDAEVCVDGNCSFSTSLWDVVTANEPHRVDTWAIDTWTDEYVLLSNSAKIITCQTEAPPNPFIAVSLTERWFWVNNFTPETPVTFYIYDDKDDENTIFEFNRNTDESGNVTIEGWEHGWLPEPGDYIVATDGFNTKDLVLEHITLDVFDPDNDFLSGEVAYPERSVDIGVGNENGEQWMNVTADGNSHWEADFTLPGYEFDITEDMWAGAHVNDEDGDVTAAHNTGPVFVFPDFQDEVFVTSEDEIILGTGWGACTPGLVTAWLHAADYHWYMDGNPIVSSKQATNYWGPVASRGPNTACLIGTGELWAASWRYSIGSLSVGDYEISLIYGTDHKMTDGGDSDGDGRLDFYQQLEANVTIHVIEP